MVDLHRYWFTWEASASGKVPLGANLGCGVTAWTRDDAEHLLRERFGDQAPAIADVVEDVDVSTLDPGHVLPNIGVVAWRGVWFPDG